MFIGNSTKYIAVQKYLATDFSAITLKLIILIIDQINYFSWNHVKCNGILHPVTNKRSVLYSINKNIANNVKIS